MAIWQHHMYLLPRQEVESYFGTPTSIDFEAFNEIDWWKNHRFTLADFESFDSILPRNKSWNENLILFGEESSTCIEILLLEGKISEVSIRIDLRKDNTLFLKRISEFAHFNNCIFWDEGLLIVNSDIFSIEQSIARNNKHQRFLDKLG